MLEVSFMLRRILPAPPFNELNRPVGCATGTFATAVWTGAGRGGGIVTGGVGRGGGVGVLGGGVGLGGGGGVLTATSTFGGSLGSIKVV